MKQVSYTQKNLPTKGNAKKIWDTLVANGYVVDELHYNKGPVSDCGTGTWACEATNAKEDIKSEWGFWCGIVGKTYVYLQNTGAPYGKYLVGFVTRKCPFRKSQTQCTFCTKTGDWPWDAGVCDSNCDALTDDQLIKLAEKYEEVS